MEIIQHSSNRHLARSSMIAYAALHDWNRVKKEFSPTHAAIIYCGLWIYLALLGSSLAGNTMRNAPGEVKIIYKKHPQSCAQGATMRGQCAVVPVLLMELKMDFPRACRWDQAQD